MIISSGHRLIFVHIPKTGGTSMALALEGRAMADDILIGDTPKARRRAGRLKGVAAAGRLWKHATLADIDGLVGLGTIREAFTFTLVRNPWDRMVSYYHWLRGQGFDHPSVRLAQAQDFSGFVNAPVTQKAWRANPARAYMTAADGVEYCTSYIRLEHLEEDAAPLWDHLGFRLDLPRANTSDHADYRSYYSPADAALLGRIAAEDIARFGYVF
ncbi:sulfotransferase family 2 domain-containing protein [uncultured Roseovarius sp.]|uniref:sulfotransferase family 2 domain-containing protein n=1 Tax=Roseovarius sp. TaxID=1486281 RepID=UPI0025E9844D|nr:sulfotransferase family 2 domain-containing protein [uncultured Roseovarius sp.]